jgi:4-hydroxybenzoate polyprenyltransferase
VLGGGGVALGFAVNWATGLGVLGYLALTTVYSLLLKHAVILDVLTLSSAFVLRVIVGAEAVQVEFSSWLVLCTFLLALFLGFGKRRHELVLLEDDAQPHRPVLTEYSPHFLDMMMAVVTTATVMSYALYTMAPETVARFHSRNLIYTSAFVLYGIFRYLYLIHKKSSGGSPVQMFYRDRPLQIAAVLWIVSVFLLRY